MDLLKEVRVVPDFPKKGIQFYDITTVLQNPDAFRVAIDEFVKIAEKIDFDVIVGLESRGFFFASVMAYKMGKSYVPVRKKGKLPYETVSEEFELEYGTDIMEIHKDAVKKGQKALLIDDLLATGGTLKAAAHLVEKLGGEVSGIICLIELEDLGGREVLSDYNLEALIKTTE